MSLSKKPMVLIISSLIKCLRCVNNNTTLTSINQNESTIIKLSKKKEKHYLPHTWRFSNYGLVHSEVSVLQPFLKMVEEKSRRIPPTFYLLAHSLVPSRKSISAHNVDFGFSNSRYFKIKNVWFWTTANPQHYQERHLLSATVTVSC